MKFFILIPSFFSIIFTHLYGQYNTFETYSKIPISLKTDSLEKIIPTQKNDSSKLLLSLFALEKSRDIYYSPKFGNDLKTIDSLVKIVGTDDVKAINYWMAAKYQFIKEEGNDLVAQKCYASIQLAEKLKDTVLLIHNYHLLMMLNIRGNLGLVINYNISNNAVFFAKKYFKKVYDLASTNVNPLIQILFKKSHIEYSFNVDINDKKVFELANAGLKIINNYPQYSYFKEYFMARIAGYHSIMGNSKIGLEYLKQCLLLPTFPKSNISISYNYSIARIFVNLLEYDSAKIYCHRAIEQIKNYNARNLIVLDFCYILLAEIEYKQKNYKTAFEIKLLDDSIYNLRMKRDNGEKFAEFEHKYEAEKKDLVNKGLVKEKRQLVALAIVGFFVFILIAGLLTILYLQNIKLKKLGVFRSKIHTIISHDLKSPFLALQGLNHEVSYLIRNGKFDNLLDLASGIDEASIKISNLLNNLLQWASADKINSREKNTIYLNETFEKVLNLYSSTIDEKHITITKNFEQLKSIVANSNVFEMVLRNWLDNTLKHSNASIIKMVSLQENSFYKILIEDNGTLNIDTAYKIKMQFQNSTEAMVEFDTGLGLELISYFSKLEKWKIEFIVGEVNEFSILIPIQKTK
ncbi:MAG: sensor histidine kinase [Dolichospermum sp.]